jgi:hypothetical protein
MGRSLPVGSENVRLAALRRRATVVSNTSVRCSPFRKCAGLIGRRWCLSGDHGRLGRRPNATDSTKSNPCAKPYDLDERRQPVQKQQAFIPAGLQSWIDARQRFGPSHAHVQMARELGMNPKKLGRLANHNQELWKLPLPQFIAMLYVKRFGKAGPDTVRTIEEIAVAKRATTQRHKGGLSTSSGGQECAAPTCDAPFAAIAGR